MATRDYTALKAQTLGAGGEEEAVTVSIRPLIDKVLARYSGEWTVLRELIQNAADAGATKVVVKWETLPSTTVPIPQSADTSTLLKHTIQHHTLKTLVVTNNGQAFNNDDWSRLKRIAEGNPDTTKIGAFGVGFYSVFADCEEPFVSSGSEAMAFYWKGNALFTRRLKLPAGEASPDTNFVLDYRETTSSVPPLMPLCQFLANSLTFVGLEKIELWLDDHRLLDLHKKLAPAIDVAIPREIDTKTPEGLMRVGRVSREVAQIDGSWMNAVTWRVPKANAVPSRFDRAQENAPSLKSFFSRLTGTSSPSMDSLKEKAEIVKEDDDISLASTSTVFLHITTASLSTSTSRTFAQELERATKKPPPKTTKVAILTASPDSEIARSKTSKKNDVFATVLPAKTGRVFIGFGTGQTTGFGAHISAPSVIPTVEREAIDLNARWVRTWNMELLRAAGIVARISWSLEMQTLKEDLQRRFPNTKKIRSEEVSSVLGPGTLAAQQHSFVESTPSSQIGQVVEDSFWTCSKQASISMLSTCGILQTDEIRVAPKELSFMEGIPTIPEQITKDAPIFVSRLTEFGLVTEVTVTDVKAALESNALTSKQLQEFINWIAQRASKNEIDDYTIKSLMAVAVANDDTSDQQGWLLVLSDIKYFLNPAKIPPELPVPASTIPLKYTRSLVNYDLECLGWQELQIIPWVKWLLAESQNRQVLSADQDLTSSPKFVAAVFPVLSKHFDKDLSKSSEGTLIELLSSRTVIPTKLGMRRPAEAYFPSVRIFDDLPIVQGLQSVKDKFLMALGVRKTLELNVVFDRLLNAPATDSQDRPGRHVELIKYLASVQSDIPATDIQKLKNTPLCPAQQKSGTNASAPNRFKVSEIFEPRPALRELGLRVLEWPGAYRSGSPEGRFLSLLGLRSFPTVTEIVEIVANASAASDFQLRDKAMGYFLANHHINGYAAFDYSRITVPWLPLNGSTKLSTSSRCFTEEGASFFGYDILASQLHQHAARFGVRPHPPIEDCIEILVKRPPKSSKEARQLFGCLSSRLGEIRPTHTARIGGSAIIPIISSAASVQSEKPASIRYVAPVNCFLGQSDTYKNIFDFVDFGQEANAFLLKCGSKHEPTKIELARLLVREPARISSTLRDPEKYLGLLRSLADSMSVIKKDKELFRAMKAAPFLLASKELPPAAVPTEKITKESIDDDADELEDDEAQGIKEWQLVSADDAIIVDDFISFNLFKHSIVCAPQEETLEDFYYTLGSPQLSNLVEEAAKHSAALPDQRAAMKLQKQIFERAQLFLHEQPPDLIKHDARWLEKNLTVKAVNSISMRRTLKGRNVTHVEKRSAVITQQNREYTLWTTAGHTDYYQISQALVLILLARPKLHSALTLEMLLKTDLLELRARGFNIARILRRKAAEARLAEERRQKQLEEERKEIEEQEKQWTEVHKKSAKDKDTSMPGVFPDSPDRAGPSTQITKADDIDPIRNPRAPRGLFSNLTKLLNDRSGNRSLIPEPVALSGNEVATAENGEQPPPPYSQNEVGRPKAPQTVTAPHQLHQNLLSAIQKSRPTGSTDVFSRGETNTVQETKSYCDEHPAHDLTFVAEGAHKMQIFLTSPNVPSSSAFLSTNTTGLNIFAGILKDVSSIFAMQLSSMNMFYDTDGKTIAFNRNGSIFCNYLFFQQLHESKLGNNRSENYAKDRGDALVYWWVIVCHELAHNLVGDHSSEHSYYTEAFVQRYFGKVVGMIAMQGQSGAGVQRAIEDRPLPLLQRD